jgi:hypothetical protein
MDHGKLATFKDIDKTWRHWRKKQLASLNGWRLIQGSTQRSCDGPAKGLVQR